MREREILVDKIARRQGGAVEFAGREQHLPQLTVDYVPIVVNRHEIIIWADCLKLPERLEQ